MSKAAVKITCYAAEKHDTMVTADDLTVTQFDHYDPDLVFYTIAFYCNDCESISIQNSLKMHPAGIDTLLNEIEFMVSVNGPMEKDLSDPPLTHIEVAKMADMIQNVNTPIPLIEGEQ